MASFEQSFGNFGNKVETLKQLFDTFIGNFLGIYRQFGLPDCLLNKGVVSKETLVLRRWGSSIQKFYQRS